MGTRSAEGGLVSAVSYAVQQSGVRAMDGVGL